MTNLFSTGIRPLVDAHILERSKEVRSYGQYWSASSAGFCMRLNILRRLEVPPVPEIAEDTLRTQRVFDAGHIFHEWMQGITREAGLSIAQELELQDEDLLIRGHIDDLVLVGELADVDSGDPFPHSQQHLILYDYKTANSQSFNYKRDTMGHYHKMQLGTYMYMLTKAMNVPKDWKFGQDDQTMLHKGLETEAGVNLPKEILEARILQISKDDLRMREQQLLWTPDLEKEVVEYWRTLQGYWGYKKLPRCTCLEHDGGFMGRRSKKGKVYNPYFWQDTPCSTEWVQQHTKLMEGWSIT